MAQRHPLPQESREEPDHEAAGKVDGQRPVRERAAGEALDEAPEKVARQPAEDGADRYRENIQHLTYHTK